MKKDNEYGTTWDDKNKFHALPANANQPQINASNKNKRQENHQGDSTIGVHTIKLLNKNKDKNKDKKNLSYIECHACKQKS